MLGLADTKINMETVETRSPMDVTVDLAGKDFRARLVLNRDALAGNGCLIDCASAR
jgi:hypothetical protein